MDSPIKAKRSRNDSNQSLTVFITFEIYKQARFGEGLFVCGNLAQLGYWNPPAALRLQWTQGNIWKGLIAVPRDISELVEFKFVISEWNLTQSSAIEWEEGPDRIIDLKLLQSQTTYSAEWNKKHVTLCLRIHSKRQPNNFYCVTGNIEELGAWKERKTMQSIERGFHKKLMSLTKGSSRSLSEPQISSYQVISFTIPRSLKSFNYCYCRWGEAAQSEAFPGRILNFYGKAAQQEGRIADIDHLGERIVIDESIFDEMVLRKISKQLYWASSLKNSDQFNKLNEKRITAILHIQSTQESCSIKSSRVKALCKQNGIYFKNWVAENLRNRKFIEQAQEIIAFLENLFIQGHRVCLHCSRKILREGPIKILYLTLLGGHTFLQAKEQVRKEVPLSENSCKVAEDVLHLVSEKMNRGKLVIYTN